MIKWLSGYFETLFLMSSRANRKHIRESMEQADRGEVTSFINRKGGVSLYVNMLIGTEVDFESNCAYVRIHECQVTESKEYDEDTVVDLCVDGEVIGVEILNFRSTLSAPTCAGADVEEWHTDIEVAVFAARSFVLQNLMKSGLYDSRPIHK